MGNASSAPSLTNSSMRDRGNLESGGNPVHLLFGNSQPTAPALVSATLEHLPAVLTRLVNWTSQNSTPGCALMPF
jgi:hypothetical protein